MRWDPTQGAPPTFDGTWSTCIVRVVDFNTLALVYQWLRSGQHPFRSVTLDSLMEIQKRCVDVINPGVSALSWDNYGELLRQIDKLVRDYRDLVMIDSNNVDVVIFLAGSETDDKGTVRPMMQGKIRKWLPFYMDVVGYYYKVPGPAGGWARGLLIDQQPGFVAKDGTNIFVSAHPEGVIWQPHLEGMLNQLNPQGGTQ